MKDINRRDFIKRTGAAAAVVGAASALQGCGGTAGPDAASTLVTGQTATAAHEPTGQMTLRSNRRGDDSVSLLGYGCMRWPTVPHNQAQPDGNDIDQEQVNRLVDYAMAHGVNYYDTSPVYCKGFSERAVGIALSRYPRDSYRIATKLSNFADSLQSHEAGVRMFETSLRELRVDYIDYYLLHSVGGGGMPAFSKRYLDNGMLDYLLKQRAKGRIRNLGFSFHGDVEVFDWCLAHDDKYHWDFVQIQMNYVDWLHAREQNARNVNADYLYGELSKRGIPAVIMEPLLGGRLSKLPAHVVSTLKERRPDMSVASWAFRFCGTYPGVMCVLSGMTYMEHLQDNLCTFSPLDPLTDSDLDYLERTAQLILKYPTVPCNDCKYCMPCPYGIDIPAIFVHYNKLVGEGTVPQSAEDPDYRRMRRAYLVSFDRAVPAVRQADHCIGCRQCESHCPQNIKIPRRLQQIAEQIEALKASL